MNRYYGETAPEKYRGGEGGSNKPMGSAPSTSAPDKTAAWPGLPGKASASRGGPQTGSMGPFAVKKVGL